MKETTLKKAIALDNTIQEAKKMKVHINQHTVKEDSGIEILFCGRRFKTLDYTLSLAILKAIRVAVQETLTDSECKFEKL